MTPGVNQSVAPPVAKPHALACPNCGGPVERRGFGYAMTVVCPQCLTVLDASTPLLQVLQKIEAEQSRRTPMIPSGIAWQPERRNLGSNRVSDSRGGGRR